MVKSKDSSEWIALQVSCFLELVERNDIDGLTYAMSQIDNERVYRGIIRHLVKEIRVLKTGNN